MPFLKSGEREKLIQRYSTGQCCKPVQMIVAALIRVLCEAAIKMGLTNQNRIMRKSCEQDMARESGEAGRASFHDVGLTLSEGEREGREKRRLSRSI